MSKITFFVDEREFVTDTPERTVVDLLERAGYAPEKHYLVRKGTEYRDPKAVLEVREGDHFETKVRDRNPRFPQRIHYKVNGEEQTTKYGTLTVEVILRNAGREASIDLAQINDYYLESIDDGRKYESLTDRVAIKEGEQFLALHRGKTPVA